MKKHFKIKIKPTEDTSVRARILREVLLPTMEIDDLRQLLLEASDEIYTLGSYIGEMDDIIMRLERRLNDANS